MKVVFVDTWAWFALVDQGDSSHDRVTVEIESLLKNSCKLVTTNYVLHESLTLIRYKINHISSVKFWDLILRFEKTKLLQIIRVAQSQEQKALSIFRSYHDQKFSVVDCCSFVVMQELKISEVISNDKHFSVMGFTCRPY